MEEEYQCSFMALQPLPTSFVSVKVLTPLQEIQICKNKFADQLQISMFSGEYWLPETNGVFSTWRIQRHPVEFLKYCYHQNRHEENYGIFFINLSDFNQDASLLNACKNACIHGYSALGAALIAEDAPSLLNRILKTSYKQDFILRLLEKGFQFTEKDKKLVALHLHDVISAGQKQMMISLLCEPQKGNLVLLPHDVRGCIVDYIVHLHKKSDWLCALL